MAFSIIQEITVRKGGPEGISKTVHKIAKADSFVDLPPPAVDEAVSAVLLPRTQVNNALTAWQASTRCIKAVQNAETPEKADWLCNISFALERVS